MAVNRFIGTTNSNWGTATNWSQGTVPTANDGHTTTFDATSPACTVNTSNRVCQILDFTGYTNTITMTFQITVSGSVTLSATMGVSGTGQLIVNSTATLTSNGKIWPNNFVISGANQIFTLADNWTVLGNVSQGAGNSGTVNGNILYIGGNLSTGAAVADGTTVYEMNGTGTISGVGALRHSLIINTAGTITFSGVNIYSTGVLTYMAGNVVTTGSILSIPASTTLNTSGIIWDTIYTTSTQTVTLTSDLYCNNLTATSNTTHTWNGNNIYISSVLASAGSGTITGTSIINLIGLSVSIPSLTGWTNNTIINTSGTVTFSGALRYNTGTMTYTAGIIITTGSTITINANTTLDTDGIVWNNITTTTGLTTLTLSSKLTVMGELWFQGDTTISGDRFETYGLMIGQVTISNSIDLVLVSTKECIVTGYIRHYGARKGVLGTISASTIGSKAILTVRQGATQIIGYVNVTDIDSSNGITLRSYDGIFSNCDNWIKLNQEITVSYGS